MLAALPLASLFLSYVAVMATIVATTLARSLS